MPYKIRISNSKNKFIVDIFFKLILYYNIKSDNVKDNNIINFKIRSFKNAVRIIKNTSFEIKGGKDLEKIKGIGKGTIERIDEIIKTKTLKELKGFKSSKININIIDELQQVINIGKTNAEELVKKYKVKSIKDLKKKVKEGKIKVNDKILMGLKYYGKVQDNIPRKEIDKFYKLILKIGKELDKNLIVKIAGSYRRQNKTSNDVDILLTHKNKDYLYEFIQKLKDKKIIIDDLTSDKSKTKYMGFSKFKDNHIRRIDIRSVPYKSYYYALLYFTGSYQLNTQMRQYAKKMGYKLNEYGLYKNNKFIPVKSEKEIFDKLKLKYQEPKYR
tara:strand:+ start:32 stop:1018 length:987 start_codon:yes stop_codon:yes gene_type:complete